MPRVLHAACSLGPVDVIGLQTKLSNPTTQKYGILGRWLSLLFEIHGSEGDRLCRVFKVDGGNDIGAT